MDWGIVSFVFFAALFAYIMVGYPVLLKFWPTTVPPVHKHYTPRTASFLIAVHNGERFLERKLESIRELDYPQEMIEILVVSDASTDGTDAIAQRFADHDPGVRLLRVPRGGKSAALNAGLAHLTGEIIVFTDVRQELGRDSLQHLMSCFADPTIGVASAQLVIRAGEKQEEAEISLYRKYDIWMRERMSEIGSAFGASGGYYAMRRSLAAPIAPDTLLDDVEFPMPSLYQGYRMVIERRAKFYDFPTTLDSEFQRRVRTLGGLWQVYTRDWKLWTPLNPMWFHFASQKLGRLLMPWALLGMTLSAAWLPRPWNWLMLAGLGAFYALGLLDLWVPQKTLPKKITSPIRSFLVMAAAAAMGVKIFFVPAQDLWKATVVNPVADPVRETNVSEVKK
jgi:cellulose synthase/poly-beta-1,6-N-acetylglucosamine synthase-like glycosyltransferase